MRRLRGRQERRRKPVETLRGCESDDEDVDGVVTADDCAEA